MSDNVTLDDVEFGERLDHERASLLIAQIQGQFTITASYLTDIGRNARELYIGQGWLALGYDSWEELCEDKFRAGALNLGKALRQSLVSELRSEGLSTRAIAPVVGVGQTQVRRDLNHVSLEGSRVSGSGVAEPMTITTTTMGRDGKVYTPSRALPQQRAEKVKAPREIATLAKRKLIDQANKTDLDIGVRHLDPVDRVQLAEVARGYAAALLVLADACDSDTVG